MKKNLFLLSFLFILVGAHMAYASTQVCGDPSQSTPDTTYISCGNGSPALIMRPWGTNSDVPHMKAGETVYDEVGIPSTCPSFISVCLDITHTDYYRNAMRVTVQQMIVNGVLPQFPTMQGWIGR